jgi:hypothetical protein
MDVNTMAKMINSVGLCFDILGAWFVAIEVVKQYKGKKYKDQPTWNDIGAGPKESQEYEKWQMLNHKWMLRGLVMLTVGFLLQVASNWVK